MNEETLSKPIVVFFRRFTQLKISQSRVMRHKSTIFDPSPESINCQHQSTFEFFCYPCLFDFHIAGIHHSGHAKSIGT